MTANTPQSRKSKGASLQKEVKGFVHDTFPELEDDDILSRSMGSSGTDLHLSPKARSLFPFDVECKRTERVKLWESWEQCKANAHNTPLLVIKRNRSDTLAVLKLEDLLEILNENRS